MNYKEARIKWILETLSFFVWQGASHFLKRGLDSFVLSLFKKGEQRSPNKINQRFHKSGSGGAGVSPCAFKERFDTGKECGIVARQATDAIRTVFGGSLFEHTLRKIGSGLWAHAPDGSGNFFWSGIRHNSSQDIPRPQAEGHG